MINLTGVISSVLTKGSAYLDPGSGSFLLQLIIAGVAGIGIFIGASWSKVKRIFRKKRLDPIDNDGEEDNEEYDD